MAEIPTPRSYLQILGDMEDAFLSDAAAQGVTSLRVGSPIRSLLEAAAQSDLRSSQDIFDLLNSISLDKANGLALIRIGEEEGVPKWTESPATGTVDISDSSFTRKATKVFQGKPAPIVGSLKIFVADASTWPSSGQLYVGRGTSNYEGPLSWSAKIDQTTYWEITLTQPTTKQHDVGESVILAQGGSRTIGAETVAKTPQANVSSAVEFRTVYSASIPDGETEVKGIVVSAVKPGNIGNVPAAAISQFATAPFSGARVTNPLPFSNGRETEEDGHYRGRIRDARKTRTKGTALAITNAVTGITASDENKRVASASIVTRVGYPTTLYLDDGTGYEEQSTGVAVEALVDSAIGGEQFFQVNSRPIAKAFLLSRNASPYSLPASAQLQVRVGGVTYTHYFDPVDFVSTSAATVHEVMASINANEALGFQARTSDSGSRVILFAKSDTNEDIEVVGGTVTEIFRFPAGVAYSLQLYKNDRLLVKDGLKAVYDSNLLGEWNTFSGTQTLQLAVDGTPALTFSFTDQDFIDAATGFTTVAKNTLAAWIAVINREVPGITASEDGGRIALTSNAGEKATAAVEIVGGTLVSAKMFATGKASGLNKDYTVDRNTGQIRLEQVLVAGDRLSVGSSNTRSFIESTSIAATTTIADADVWFAVDGEATRVTLGLSSTNPVTVSVAGLHEWGHRLKISTTVPAFINVREGDWMVSYDANLHSSLRGNFRVAEVERNVAGDVLGTWVTIERKSAMMARAGHATVSLNPVASAIAKVLTAGGAVRPSEPNLALNPYIEGTTAACEVFDPNMLTASAVASMTTARAYHTATVLADGRVLVTGGISANGVRLASTEVYDPLADTWSSGPALPVAVSHHKAVLLASGDVLITGGYTGSAFSTLTCRYNTGAGTITNLTGAAPLNTARAEHQMVLLNDGRVLICGGLNGTGALKAAEIFDSGIPSSTNVASMTVARRDFGAILYSTNTPLIAGNHRSMPNRNTFETYNVGGDAWTIGQLSGSKYVFFESNQLVAAGADRYAMNCWYETAAGVRTPVVYRYSGGSWSEIAYNPKNTDFYTYHEKRWVEVHTADLSTQKMLIGVDGYAGREQVARSGAHDDKEFTTVAQVEWFDANTNTWPTNKTDNAVTSPTVNLSSPPGLVFVRTVEPLQRHTLAAGANYTATTLVSSLNTTLKGATASVYKTDRLRVTTNTHGIEGDLALVAANTVGATTFKLPVADAIDNLVGHMASVESVNGEAGTPTFQELSVVGLAKANPDAWGTALLDVSQLSGGHQLVGLRDAWGGPTTTYHRRFGSNLNARLRSFLVTPAAATGDACQVDIRSAPPSKDLLVHERFYAGAPYAIGPEDDLVVQVDDDLNKRFAVSMWRKLKPTNAVYGATNTFKDADASNVSLAETFGLQYPFEDFTVYMKARAVAFDGDANRRALFRWYRVGPDGEYARVRFANPLAADGTTAVVVDNKDTKSNVRIRLPSGAARTPSIRSTTRLAYACTGQTGSVGTLVFAIGFVTTEAQRTDAANETRLRIQLPAAITTCGLATGQVIYLASTNGGFASGTYTVVSVAAASGPGGTQDVIVTDNTAGDLTVGASIGTISLDSQGAALFSGVGIVAGDYLRVSKNSSVGAQFTESTFRITTVAAQHLICTSGETVFTSGLVNPALSIAALNLSANLSIFASAPPTISVLATTINAAAGVDNSTCPITMLSLGTGTGTVDRSTPEELMAQSWYDLADGVNWVSKSISPGSIAGDYQFTFKKAITGTLSTTTDWVNEEVRLCPTTTANAVKWLSTPVVTGLSASCTAQASSDAAKVQLASKMPGTAGAIQVQGGLANSVAAAVVGEGFPLTTKGLSTVSRSLALGLTSAMWVAIDNTLPLAKAGVFSTSTELQSWTAAGLLTLNQNVYTTLVEPTTARLTFEKQGKFVAISLPGLDTEKYKVKSISRVATTDIYTVVVQLPTGLTSTGWQVGDVVSYKKASRYEIVRAQAVDLGDTYLFDLKLRDGAAALDYIVTDTFQLVESNHASFPNGTYTVTVLTAQADGTVRVTCTNGAVPANVTAAYSVGYAERSDADFADYEAKLTSVSALDIPTNTVTVTFVDPTGTDKTRNWLGYISQQLFLSGIPEGHILRVTAPAAASSGWADKQVPVQDLGLFRIVRMQEMADVPGQAGTIWIENSAAVEGTFETRIAVYDGNSIMPGDELVLNTSLWGGENQGTWTVERVGVADETTTAEFTTPTKFKVKVSDRTPRSMGNPGPLGTQSALVHILEEKPRRIIKKIEGICPNADNGAYVDIRWDTQYSVSAITAQAGSVISALDKLAFSTTLATGKDGYSYNTGLIGEANKIVYGDPSDTSTYPGVAAAGAVVNISGPLIKRLKLALQIRVRTGASTTDIANRVRSAVATLVNKTGVGEPVAISAIVAAATKVVGVVAVTVVSPVYNTENDLIAIQPFEKPLIVQPTQDISVTFAGE